MAAAAATVAVEKKREGREDAGAAESPQAAIWKTKTLVPPSLGRAGGTSMLPPPGLAKRARLKTTRTTMTVGGAVEVPASPLPAPCALNLDREGGRLVLGKRGTDSGRMAVGALVAAVVVVFVRAMNSTAARSEEFP